jgi:queuine tRNA-ribosyltransferase
MPFDGYAVGGLSVGEPERLIYRGMDLSLPHLPWERPRYAMGVGLFPQMLEGVARGVDMFDCVVPTRFGRNGTAFTRTGRYPVKAGRYRDDPRPIEEGCTCYACRHFSRAYVRHLLNVDEILGVRLVTMHNLHRYAAFLGEIREALLAGTFAGYRRAFHAAYQPEPGRCEDSSR